LSLRPRGTSAFRRKLTVSPEDFAKQSQWLASNGYKAITLLQLYRALAGDFILPEERPVILTFDDGYSNIFTYALPVMRFFNQTAVFFVITDYLDSPGYLSWEQVKKL